MSFKDWLLLFVPSWPAETWLTAAIAAAVIVQAVVAWRLWELQGHVEIFSRLVRERIGAGGPRLHLEVVNLSAVGIYVDSIAVESRFGLAARAAAPPRFIVAVQGNVAPFQRVAFYIHEDVYREIPKYGDAPHGVNIKTRPRYRAHGKWCDGKWSFHFASMRALECDEVREIQPNKF